MPSTGGFITSVLIHNWRLYSPSIRYELLFAVAPLRLIPLLARMVYPVREAAMPGVEGEAPGISWSRLVNERSFSGISMVCVLLMSVETVAVCDCTRDASACTSTLCCTFPTDNWRSTVMDRKSTRLNSSHLVIS